LKNISTGEKTKVNEILQILKRKKIHLKKIPEGCAEINQEPANYVLSVYPLVKRMCVEFEENISRSKETKKSKTSGIKSIVKKLLESRPSCQHSEYMDLGEVVEVSEIAVAEDKTEACEQYIKDCKR
jgi:hypothetical protein